MHNVEIDLEQIHATFDQYADQVETLQGEHIAAGDDAPGAHRSAWAKPARLVAGFLAHQVAPNWSIPESDMDEWADALAHCADQLMPGGMGNVESWGPWGKLFFASVSVALCGLDMETLTIRPLRAPKPTGAADDGEDSNSPRPGETVHNYRKDREDPISPPGGRYTVGG